MVHPLAAQIIATGTTELPDGTAYRAESYIVLEECDLIYDAVAAAKPRAAIEVGMAHGVSSLCIADAMRAADPSSRLTIVDPHQRSFYRSSGLHLLQRAGLAPPRLIEEPSDRALPRLVEAEERYQFGFIDGWHTFDHTLVDFFYIDKLLDIGGIVILSDSAYPAIHAVARFVLANRNYELFRCTQTKPPRGAKRAIKRLLRPLARTDRDPSPATERAARRIEGAGAVALVKRGHDERRYDHWVAF